MTTQATAPTTFRKRPLTVQALQWTGTNLADMLDFTGGRFELTDPEQRLADIRERVAARPEPHWQAAIDLAWLLAEYDRREAEYNYDPPAATEGTECAGIWMPGTVPADEARHLARGHYQDEADSAAAAPTFTGRGFCVFGAGCANDPATPLDTMPHHEA